MVVLEAMVCLVFRFHNVMHLSTFTIVQMQVHPTMEVKKSQIKISKNKSSNSNRQSIILLETRTSTNHYLRLKFHLKFACVVLPVDLTKIPATSVKVNTQFKLKGMSTRN
jgi:type IV secretory pathway VirB4 component